MALEAVVPSISSPRWLITWVMAIFLVLHAGALPTRPLQPLSGARARRTRLSRRMQQGLRWVSPILSAS